MWYTITMGDKTYEFRTKREMTQKLYELSGPKPEGITKERRAQYNKKYWATHKTERPEYKGYPKRGRPKKTVEALPVKKPRGRPKKIITVEAKPEIKEVQTVITQAKM